MPIDGVGGPKGPGPPGAPKGVEPAEGREKVEKAGEPFRVGEAGATEASEGPVPVSDPTVVEAVQGVISDLQAGRIPSVEAAFDAVIERIVEARYPAMTVRQRERFSSHLQRMLADDPGVGAAITAMLERARKAE